jgi:hypothetical protein
MKPAQKKKNGRFELRPTLIFDWQSHHNERVAMFLSALELRNIIESSFLPKRCQCTLSPDLSMTIKVYSDVETDHLDLIVTGIDAQRLNGCREINDLIAELRTGLAHNTHGQLFIAKSKLH